jgi:two-component system phosphate regulon sensor histidine kinase PhoR
MQMLNDDELLGIDKNSGFASRVLILSIPAGSIFLLLAIFNVLDVTIALYSYISVIFFNVIFLMPISTELQQIKKYISNLSSGVTEDELLNNMTEKETQNLITAINSMHKFWANKTETLENRTLSDAAVLDTLPDPLFMVSKEGKIIGANLAARKLFEDDINNTDFITLIADEKFKTALHKVLNGISRKEDLNLNLLSIKNKPKVYVQISTLPWFTKGEIVAVVSFYDLTKALQLEQIQQDFVANASHELRTPLSVIAGFIETLQTSAKDDEVAREKFLRIIQDQTSFMSSLIENLLSLSKIELSFNTTPTEKVNINNIIKETNSFLELKLKPNNLKIKTKLSRLPQIVGDTYQLTQILQNLMDNAIKYSTPSSEIKITTEKTPQIPPHRYYDVKEGEAIKISISNQGNPIAPEDLERLTERFYRLQSHKNKNIKGTGLGLAIVSQIIKRHKGNMIVTSLDGTTDFSIYLPIKQ